MAGEGRQVQFGGTALPFCPLSSAPAATDESAHDIETARAARAPPPYTPCPIPRAAGPMAG
ncbi:hypothetical protein C7412_102344 [Paraburkholderia silvatlantica]|nr:hypothetical protein C7412_102344 [Paraburkholderia silvatlantica]